MSRNPQSVEISDFNRGRIVRQSRAGLSQWQIEENLEIPLSTVTECWWNSRVKARKALHHAQVVHSQLRGFSVLSRDLWNRILQQLQLMWPKWLRRTEELLSGISMPLGRAARRKPLLRPFNNEHRKQWGSEMISKSMEFWDTVVFSDESRLAQFSDSGRI